MVLPGETAPNFQANAVMPNNEVKQLDFHQSAKGAYSVLFFWPFDFTFVCPTEIIAFNEALAEFEKRGVKVFGCSIDSVFVHSAWKATPPNKGGVGDVQFPMISDVSHEIMHAYGCVNRAEHTAFRGLFVMDRELVVRHALVNDAPLGRSVPEVLRIIDALQHHEKHGEVCPANWKRGERAMKPSAQGVANYLSELAKP
uniref:thioredoxin-dependent peroxiredoxin n=1 Tax=Dermatophagoides pteronyssinus TaxID=6956 RepID=A0A6P6XYC4_DERPT|nr:uncharacterized protein LOC113792340 [Dermatophagoides pteronyssinus]